MTREQHLEQYKIHQEKATDALHRLINEGHYNSKAWEEYKAETKQANKHKGIADAMWTRWRNKQCGVYWD